jgi:hypothetical protein
MVFDVDDDDDAELSSSSSSSSSFNSKKASSSSISNIFNCERDNLPIDNIGQLSLPQLKILLTYILLRAFFELYIL